MDKLRSQRWGVSGWCVAAAAVLCMAVAGCNVGPKYVPPTMTSPVGSNSIPNADIGEEEGAASIRVSVPRASHGSERTVCRHRAIPDFPELDPPFRTIT